MRLFELIQEDPFTVQDTERKTLPSFATDTYRGKNYIDQGYFSSVFGHPDNPHDVVKGSKRFDSEDGYEGFIRALAEDETMRDNIYMPRIRTARVITSTKTGQKSTMIRMERLQQLKALSEREAYMILVNLIGRTNAFEYKETKEVDTWQRALKYFLDMHSGNMPPSSDIINEDWLEAYNWVQRVSREKGWHMDLHSENWMMRRTPYGPQLVITDPFSWRRISR